MNQGGKACTHSRKHPEVLLALPPPPIRQVLGDKEASLYWHTLQLFVHTWSREARVQSPAGICDRAHRLRACGKMLQMWPQGSSAKRLDNQSLLAYTK